ncbi:Two-component system response regulator [Chitinispirillum alkaliphilum]|nr:Two-component system response regulator [Chitinispirillum alkaliphilum]
MEQELSYILLVEDNESHALLVKRGLEQCGNKCRLVHVTDGEDGLDYLFNRRSFTQERRNPRPKFVFLDLRLPRMDGLDVLKEIKSSDYTRDIPVIILTSSMAEPDIVRAYYYNANSYLVKHIDFSQFRKQIIDTVEYWINWNITPL